MFMLSKLFKPHRKNKWTSTIVATTLVFMLLCFVLSTEAAQATTVQEAHATTPEPLRVAYLTFDDGPTRGITCAILDTLEQEDVPATFFILPKRDLDDIFQRIIDNGHEVGNHSFSHNFSRLYGSSLDAFKREIKAAHAFMLDNFDYTMTSFRFPGGTFGRSRQGIAQRRAFLRSIGYREFGWDVDPQDFRDDVRRLSGPELANKVLRSVDRLNDRQHITILFHDSPHRHATVRALPYVIEGLRERGFTFDIMRNHPLSEAEIIAYQERIEAISAAKVAARREVQQQAALSLAAESLY